MQLGQFSVRLAVKNVTESKVFYEKLGFKCHPECAFIEDKWLMAQDLDIQSPTKGESGPTHFMLKDPDGNGIMFNQF